MVNLTPFILSGLLQGPPPILLARLRPRQTNATARRRRRPGLHSLAECRAMSVCIYCRRVPARYTEGVGYSAGCEGCARK
jgi:hypothetical protein